MNDDLRNDLLKVKNTSELNDKYAYKTFEFFGQFDHARTISAEASKEGTFGHTIYTPFIYHDKDSLEEKTIWVDRGYSYGDTRIQQCSHNSSGYLTLKGFICAEHSTKHTKPNDYKMGHINSINLKEFCDIHNIKDDLARQVYVKQIDSNDNQAIYPLAETMSSLNKFNTSVEEHGRYSRFFKSLAFLGLFGNMAMWVAF